MLFVEKKKKNFNKKEMELKMKSPTDGFREMKLVPELV